MIASLSIRIRRELKTWPTAKSSRYCLVILYSLLHHEEIGSTVSPENAVSLESTPRAKILRQAPPMTGPPQQTIRLQLRILDEPVAVEAPRPPKRVRLDEVLPLLRDID